MHNLPDLKEWKALNEHQQEISHHHMRDWFNQDSSRYAKFNISCQEILLDYSRNRINDTTIRLFCDLANAIQLKSKIAALFNGGKVNHSEGRPALHTALRDLNYPPISINDENITQYISQTHAKSHEFVNQVHKQEWKGATGKPIQHIINIGIGGSYTGPMMAVHALKDFAVTDLQFHFISSIDKSHLNEVLQRINPETALFIISSKSFTTIETLTNAKTIMAWMKTSLGENIQQHFIAITAAEEKARAIGIAQDNIFPLWEWVGGRYSIWSAIGLPLMLMIGNEQFNEFLQGAYEIDQHFRTADYAVNIPVMMALLGIWYINFFGVSAQAIVPYPHRLRYLIPYLQQADMESNGKSISLNGDAVGYTTGPVLFGEEGVIGQHAYHQLLHQGNHLIPVDFILAGDTSDTHQDILLASALSQAQALMRGKTYDEAYRELLGIYPEAQAREIAKHRIIAGNKPNNLVFLNSLTPKTLGALLAIYEHKIFVQGVIWGINSFDQFGVELGKQLLPEILQKVQSKPEKLSEYFYETMKDE